MGYKLETLEEEIESFCVSYMVMWFELIAITILWLSCVNVCNVQSLKAINMRVPCTFMLVLFLRKRETRQIWCGFKFSMAHVISCCGINVGCRFFLPPTIIQLCHLYFLFVFLFWFFGLIFIWISSQFIEWSHKREGSLLEF